MLVLPGEIIERVHRDTVVLHLEVEVWPGSKPCGADSGNVLASGNTLSRLHEDLRHMRIKGLVTVAMVNKEVVAVAVSDVLHPSHYPRLSGIHWSTVRW